MNKNLFFYKNYLTALLIVLAVLGFNGCKPRSPHVIKTICKKQSSLLLQYSKGFSVDYYDGFKVIQVFKDNDTAKKSAVYVLYPKGKAIPVGFESAIPIETPVSTVACFSTTHIAALSLLQLSDRIVAVANPDLIYDSVVNAAVKSKRIADFKKDYQPDFEILVAGKPSIVMSDGEYSEQYAKMKSLKLTVVSCKDYFEQDPLARAEWLKFTAAFFDKEKLADSIFKVIEKNYNDYKTVAKSVEKKPTVFCNIPYKELWYMPCGSNYSARLIADAGGDFLWKDAVPTNGLNLTLTFEQVYAKAAGADFWLNTGTIKTTADLIKQDHKFGWFKAYKNHGIYNGYARNTTGGGTDLWESGVYRPDIVLGDLIQIFHPNLLPEKKLFYYEKVK